MSVDFQPARLTTPSTWAESQGLPMTLLLDYSEEDYIGEVGTREYVQKATDHFTDFYGGGREKLERSKFRADMQKKVIEQIKYVIAGKNMEQGLDAIGVWMSKDILFPQILEAHQRPSKKLDLVELYLHIHKRRK